MVHASGRSVSRFLTRIQAKFVRTHREGPVGIDVANTVAATLIVAEVIASCRRELSVVAVPNRESIVFDAGDAVITL